MLVFHINENSTQFDYVEATEKFASINCNPQSAFYAAQRVAKSNCQAVIGIAQSIDST